MAPSLGTTGLEDVPMCMIFGNGFDWRFKATCLPDDKPPSQTGASGRGVGLLGGVLIIICYNVRMNQKGKC